MSGRTFVIGDLHGCIDELEYLLDSLQPAAADTLCFLGDYIDRGPSSQRVVERMIRLRDEGPSCVFLKGNHEDMFLAYLGYGGRHGEVFLFNGGRTTLASYGLDRVPSSPSAARLPPAHLEFLLSLQTHAYFGRFLCVHAGIRPSLPLAEQVEEDLLWIREEFIDAKHSFPYTVLYGHTPQREIRLRLPYAIGLDTGLVYGNRLSCLELSQRELWQIARGARTTTRRTLAREFTAAGLDPA